MSKHDDKHGLNGIKLHPNLHFEMYNRVDKLSTIMACITISSQKQFRQDAAVSDDAGFLLVMVA
jgi:hypothetical protein